ncbi:unnamed protein product [Lepeophtheirus salmonis]|uniref:(salmon louse) hypothetical protein n=1 Tax=Lepeophtheirus salmonis TaxID=72036 RepID=A0A0K2VFE0_LEPSM|nr:unnamed protein product [Lepeophtheirus salmonis]CAF2945288.1 unnamed protein product [Lepeophtheirus salmonis]
MFQTQRILKFLNYSPISNKSKKRILRKMSNWSGEEFTIPVPWGVIAGRKWGDSKGHPWLALHGWLDNAGTFDKLVPLFPKNHRLYCIDYPGHGFSSHIPKGMMYHFIESTSYLRRIANHLNLDKYSLMGHSFGGAISMIHTGIDSEPISHVISIDLIRPYVVESNVIVESAKNSIDTLFTIERKFEMEPEKVYSYEEVFKKLELALNRSNNQPHKSKDSIDTLLKRGLQKSKCGEGFILTRDARHLVPTLQRLTPQLYKEVLKRINVPHMIIKSDKSLFYGDEEEVMENVKLLKDSNPMFEYVLVDGYHHVHLDDPKKVITHIENFLNKYPV